MRVFVAGASGAIGEPLIAELLKQGHSVIGMTTSEARAESLQKQGVEAVVTNAFDAVAVETVLRRSNVEAVIDEADVSSSGPERYGEVCGGRQEAED